ncbi:Sulfide:quinone oxidoreductase, Type VI [hydrothermal vent metagenome]|uniref:Sulfide:quinone oxidoreductase, Type VI n=1 Tax=hydrothermal vent metagenome TaxID=652676 RepID=A0A3B1AAL5_9ZZZZ
MRKKIIIIGNGFASLFFIQYFLAIPVFPFFIWFLRRVYSKYDITVIGNGQFTYFPGIPEFITGKKTKKGITVDIKPFLKRRNIHFIDDMVTDIQDAGRTVITNNGTYKNDALFVGIGPAFLKDDIPGTREHTLSPCDGPDSMEMFIQKLQALDSGIIYLGFKINKLDGFVSGRAGQMYECAGLLDYALKEKGLRDKFEIHFFSSNLSADDKGMITDRLEERGIILDYGYEPAEFIEGGMRDEDGSFRKADLVLFSPGITGSKLVQNSCLPVSAGGQIDADKYGQVKGLNNVFASGDCANHEDPPPWVPHQAHMAQLRSQAAAKNMQAVLNGKQAEHTYRYELSCIMNLENDAMWLHMASDNKPPFWNIFPKRSKKLIKVKDMFESLYLIYLRFL